jgi:hypothetical protein
LILKSLGLDEFLDFEPKFGFLGISKIASHSFFVLNSIFGFLKRLGCAESINGESRHSGGIVVVAGISDRDEKQSVTKTWRRETEARERERQQW